MKGMIPMNVKSFLYRVRREMREIQIKQMQIAQIRSSLLPSGIRYDVDKVQTSPSDQISEVMARADEIDRRIAADVDAMQEDLFKAMDMIDALEDSRERQVLTLYFLTPTVNRMEDVAEIMSYSVRQVFTIYEEALKHCSELQSDP